MRDRAGADVDREHEPVADRKVQLGHERDAALGQVGRADAEMLAVGERARAQHHGVGLVGALGALGAAVPRLVHDLEDAHVQERLVRRLEVGLLDPQRDVVAAAALVAQRADDDELRLHQHLRRVADQEPAIEIGQDDLGDAAGREHADRCGQRRQDRQERVERVALEIRQGFDSDMAT